MIDSCGLPCDLTGRQALMAKLFPPIPHMKDPTVDKAEPGELVGVNSEVGSVGCVEWAALCDWLDVVDRWAAPPPQVSWTTVPEDCEVTQVTEA